MLNDIYTILRSYRNGYRPFPYRSFMHKYKIIFIHIPRTGGTSVLRYFNVKNLSRDHSPWIQYRSSSPWAFQKYFKFAVIRNPWDRLASAYKYLLAGGNKSGDLYIMNFLKQFRSFDSFVESGLDTLMSRNVLLFMPQSYFICNEKNEIMMDELIRFENLEIEFNSKEYIKGKAIVKTNLSIGKPYYELYTDNTIELVYQKYKNDIEAFGYSYISDR